MCGIVGINQVGKTADVEKMLESVQYRGPDKGNVVKAKGWTLGHTGVGLIDMSNGKQPMADKKAGAHIVHNGEIYNYRELREELGGKWKSDTDTEVILRLHTSGMSPEEWVAKLDGIFAFAIVDKDGLLLARDPMGVKPLYLGLKDDKIVFGSEIKSVLAVADRIMEFPAGQVYTTKGGGRTFRQIQGDTFETLDSDEIAQELLARLTYSVQTRMVSDQPIGVFLSGGLDSSLIAALASQVQPKVKTFAVGMVDSPDLEAARTVAQHLGTEHFEATFTLEDALRVLPKVIYHLESFDAAHVRSAIANYFASELAVKHVRTVLSGEGADELYAGYDYLKSIHGTALTQELLEITEALHFTDLQRCDRMNMAHGLEVRVPFLGDLRVVEHALAIPVQYKLEPKKNIEKWILRKAADGLLPHDIAWRKKMKFAHGTGIARKMFDWADKQITDDQFARAQSRYSSFDLRTKEELAYFTIFRRKFPVSKVVPIIGRSRSI